MHMFSIFFVIVAFLIQAAIAVGVTAVVGYFVIKLAVKAALREWEQEKRNRGL